MGTGGSHPALHVGVPGSAGLGVLRTPCQRGFKGRFRRERRTPEAQIQDRRHVSKWPDMYPIILI